MAKEVLEEQSMSHLLKADAHLVPLPEASMHLNYDEDADVLYLPFQDQPDSTHSEMSDEGVILDYKDDSLVGLTILEATHR